MKDLIFVTTRIPYPPTEGHQIRTYHLLRRLAGEYNVHLLSFCRTDEEPQNAEHLRSFCKSVKLFDIPLQRSKLRLVWELLTSPVKKIPFVVTRYRSKELSSELGQLVSRLNPSLLHLDMLPLADYRNQAGKSPIVINNHNVESLLLKRRATATGNILEKIFFWIQARKLSIFERNACNDVNKVLVCSAQDKKVLQILAPKANIVVIPNGVDSQYFVNQSDKVDTNQLVFVGGMGWYPNKDGIDYFCKEILPLVREHNPNIKLVVVGKTNGVKKNRIHQDEAEYVGFVEDFRPVVAEAGIYIIPLRVGSGTRLKALEAMSMSKAIVSTSIGIEGIEVESGNHLIIADSPTEMADAIIQLISDKERIKELGKSCRKLVEERYDWGPIGDRLVSLYQDMLTKDGQ